MVKLKQKSISITLPSTDNSLSNGQLLKLLKRVKPPTSHLSLKARLRVKSRVLEAIGADSVLPTLKSSQAV